MDVGEENSGFGINVKITKRLILFMLTVNRLDI